jgi:hypothetical protein
VESKLQDILNSVTVKPGRSRLEPYREFIDELRRRGLTYRDIAGILAEKCQLQVSKSAINDFVRVRSRQKRNTARRIAIDAMIVDPIVPKATTVASAQKPSEDEVRQRIAAFKARKPVTTPSRDTFHFDPSEPLRLITREKPGSGK